MQQMNCNIIRDILPIYADGVVCQDTHELVSQHLAACEDCKKIFETMQTPLSLPIDSESAPLRTIRNKWTKKAIAIAIVAFITALATLSSVAYVLLFPSILFA